MSKVNDAWQIVVDICNSPDVGYSQVYREAQTKNGITYFDCSSLLSYALYKSGILKTNPWFTTRNERVILIENGFTEYDADVKWKNGDIVWRSGHTEMVYDAANYITMGAHTSNTTLAKQVCINNFSGKGKWSFLYRYEKEGSDVKIIVSGHAIQELLNKYEFADEDVAKVKEILTACGFMLSESTKSLEEVAKEVINGLWGNGDARKSKLEAAGYNYAEVQAKVNELLNDA